MLGSWTHIQDEPDAVFFEALQTARSQDWQETSKNAAVRRLRILGIATLIYATLQPDKIPSKLGLFESKQFPDEDRLWIASTIMRTFGFFTYELTPINLATHWQTEGAGSAKMQSKEAETAGLPAVAVVALALTGAALLGFVSIQAHEVIDRYLARNALHSELMAAHGAAIEMIGSHRDHELKTGNHEPFTAQELEQIAILEERQRAAYKSLTQTTGPLPSPFEGAIERTAKQAGSFLLYALGLLLIVLSLQKRRGEKTTNE